MTKLPGNWTRLAMQAIGALALCTTLQCQAETMTRMVPGVKKVNFTLPAELTIRQGQEEKLIVDAEKKVLSRLSVIQKGDTLTLASNGSFSTDKPIKIALTIMNLQNLKTSGSGNILVEKMSGSNFDVESSGSDNILMQDIRPDRLAIDLSGSGDIEVSGKGSAIAIRLSGSGDIDAAEFAVRDAVAAIDGSGDIKVNPSATLKAEISGAGQIKYRGKPKVITEISGAGSVDKL